jgi:hypothetical protein
MTYTITDSSGTMWYVRDGVLKQVQVVKLYGNLNPKTWQMQQVYTPPMVQ